MPQINNEISKGLELLYDYSGNFKVSIELILKLAQQLKLETFVDKLSYTSGDPNTQRLSIAGSSILLDIDFIKDDTIVSVSVSQGSNEEVNVPGEYMAIESGEINKVTLDISKAGAKINFLSGTSGVNSKAESILVDNLTSKTLGNFPSNLKYLGNIDSLSSTTNENLFLEVEKIALLLSSINEIEGKILSADISYQRYESSIGKVHLNNVETGQLGLLIEFWQDYRLLSPQEVTKERQKSYSFLINLQPTALPQSDYLNDVKEHVWQFQDKKYKFDVLGTSMGPNNWLLNLSFNTPIVLPIFVLEFLGYKYTTEARTELPGILQNFNNDIPYEGYSGSSNLRVKFANELSQPQFQSVTSIEITKLSDLQQLVPILRSFLALTNILKNLGEETAPCDGRSPAEDSKRKRRESLNLQSEVTDEEILGIHALTETANFSNNIQPIRKYTEVETFLDGDDEALEHDESERLIEVVLKSVDFSSNLNPLVFLLSYHPASELEFLIVNGEVCFNGEQTQDLAVWEEFPKSLNLDGDLVAASVRLFM